MSTRVSPSLLEGKTPTSNVGRSEENDKRTGPRDADYISSALEKKDEWEKKRRELVLCVAGPDRCDKEKRDN